jgi:hypothetical protein
MLDEFKELPIWKVFALKNKNNFNIDEVVEYALPLLDQYYRAFPKYTLHNRQHQKNILRIIGELLGSKVENLTDLECLLIILSAFFHDLGMVFKDEDLKNIEKESSFHQFLDNNYKAKLLYLQSGSTLTTSLAEWYCRSMHAKRVWLFLDILEKYKWGSISLKNVLGDICESHNSDAEELINDRKFDTSFIGQADLRFCAVLLRLGDILDFDNTRSPISVYEFLGLDKPKNKSEQVSQIEWQKHLCSDGFKFERDNDIIKLRFISGPPHPQVETNIHTFLDVIEEELKKCFGIISKCSERWREFKLPISIDRASIISQNYKKGDYKLSLDESQIIQLLVGENLYDNEFVFLRELMQNAIDTSRMRQFHEQSRGIIPFQLKPIEITTWMDAEGYKWVRIDDFGMGINEYVVKNHLLKKGNSFYKSDYFKIQKQYYKQKVKSEFTPISRFGIGLLSCFIIGDSIEISTKSIAISETNSPEEQIRLSIYGLQGQYIIQTAADKHMPIEMPKINKNEKGFREEFGTSIAVRINKSKDYLQFDEHLRFWLNRFVTSSPIDIYFNSIKVNLDFESTINTALSLQQFLPFSPKIVSEINNVLNIDFKEEIGLEILPISVSHKSKNPNLKGQLVFFRLRSKELESGHYAIDWEVNISFTDKKKVEFRKRFSDEKTKSEQWKTYEVELTEEIDSILNIKLFDQLFKEVDGSYYYGNRILLIHNGINVPNYGDERYSRRFDQKIKFRDTLFSFDAFPIHSHYQWYTCFGLIYLQDDLIPDLSIARDTIKRIGYNIYSSIFYSTKEINDNLTHRSQWFDYLENVDEDFSFEELYNDFLTINNIWNNEEIIHTAKGLYSINTLQELIKKEEIEVYIPLYRHFISVLVGGLLKMNFHVVYKNTLKESSTFIIKSVNSNFKKQPIDQFHPLIFIEFEDSQIISYQKLINTKHHLIQWFVANQEILLNEYNGYCLSFIRAVLDGNFAFVNTILDYFRKVLINELHPPFYQLSDVDYQQD